MSKVRRQRLCGSARLREALSDAPTAHTHSREAMSYANRLKHLVAPRITFDKTASMPKTRSVAACVASPMPIVGST
jgi:hypothetical protein